MATIRDMVRKQIETASVETAAPLIRLIPKLPETFKAYKDSKPYVRITSADVYNFIKNSGTAQKRVAELNKNANVLRSKGIKFDVINDEDSRTINVSLEGPSYTLRWALIQNFMYIEPHDDGEYINKRGVADFKTFMSNVVAYVKHQDTQAKKKLLSAKETVGADTKKSNFKGLGGPHNNLAHPANKKYMDAVRKANEKPKAPKGINKLKAFMKENDIDLKTLKAFVKALTPTK